MVVSVDVAAIAALAAIGGERHAVSTEELISSSAEVCSAAETAAAAALEGLSSAPVEPVELEVGAGAPIERVIVSTKLATIASNKESTFGAGAGDCDLLLSGCLLAAAAAELELAAAP